MKTCTRCKVEKPLDNYSRAGQSTQAWCRACQSDYQRDYRARNQERLRDYQREYKARDPERARRLQRQRKLKHLYGVEHHVVEQMKESQAGLCAICNVKPGARGLHVDHCHTTGLVRELLCMNCNVGLGAFKDSPQLLVLAKAYLNKHSKKEGS